MYPIGTEIYYTGDMANPCGHFVVIGHRNGFQHDLREDNGERTLHGIMHIADSYAGTCSDRFVTMAAYRAYRDAKIKEFELAAKRAAYLAHQSELSA